VGEYQRYRVLWPLVPAMAMVMIDFTIVSISSTTIQRDLGLSETGQQWLVTAYALSTAAFVALGGRLGDILGHRRIVVAGILLFAGSSLLCGLVPDSESLAEPWLICFRVLQGIGGGLLIPSATVLVLDAFPGDERGRGLARPDRRLLSDRVLDLEGDLLDQRPGGPAGPDRALLRPTEGRQASRPDRLAGRGPAGGRDGPCRARHPAVDRLGVG
jgi:hypothetical protein